MYKVREIKSLPVLAFIAADDQGQEWLVDYDLFNEDCREAVRAGLASSIEEAEDEGLAALTPDMACVVRRADADD